MGPPLSRPNRPWSPVCHFDITGGVAGIKLVNGVGKIRHSDPRVLYSMESKYSTIYLILQYFGIS